MQRDDGHLVCEPVNGRLCMHCRHCTTAEPIPHPIKISWLEAMFATFKKPHLACVAGVLVIKPSGASTEVREVP